MLFTKSEVLAVLPFTQCFNPSFGHWALAGPPLHKPSGCFFFASSTNTVFGQALIYHLRPAQFPSLPGVPCALSNTINIVFFSICLTCHSLLYKFCLVSLACEVEFTLLNMSSKATDCMTPDYLSGLISTRCLTWSPT